MGPDQEITKEQRLVEQLDHSRRMLDNAHMQIGHLRDDVMFWKKLALKQLGVEDRHINELVHMGGLGAVGMSTAPSAGAFLSRGY